MKIKQISVNGLFGIFDHVIPLNMDDRITIIHGPNGFGKTAMLRMLSGFFNSQYSVFRNIPFIKFKVEFDDSSSVEVVKISEDSEKQKKKEQININFYESNSEKISFSSKNVKNDLGNDFPISILDELIPEISRIGPRIWRHLVTGETLSLDDVINKFEDLLPSKMKLRDEPEWLSNLKNNIYIRLIESQRLLNISPSSSSRNYSSSPSMLPTVSAYSDELAQLIKSKLAEYGTTSQSLDRTFPARVVQQKTVPDLKVEQILHQLKNLEESRSRLIEVGLLDKDDNSDFQINPEAKDIDDSTKNILSVYVEDVEKKLSVFNEVADKIELLQRIINSKFAYSSKEMSFNKEKGFVFKTPYNYLSNTDNLSPTDLSSGEQHELVLLYELLFKVKSNSLVLIDEPELSLHVGWQSQFLKDLQDIIKVANLDILMATHSPDIIQDRWDLTVELKGRVK
ncbi:MAG: AAA family ATPase [Pseudanabaena sp. M046S1SP1A06QC]|nr:AAA family ATPase [Pseudanabaena sp. M046S1SP1A06QC]